MLATYYTSLGLPKQEPCSFLSFLYKLALALHRLEAATRNAMHIAFAVYVINIPILFTQVHYILNELVMGGMVLETSMTEIITRIEEQNKIEKQEVSMHISVCVHMHTHSKKITSNSLVKARAHILTLISMGIILNNAHSLAVMTSTIMSF